MDKERGSRAWTEGESHVIGFRLLRRKRARSRKVRVLTDERGFLWGRPARQERERDPQGTS